MSVQFDSPWPMGHIGTCFASPVISPSIASTCMNDSCEKARRAKILVVEDNNDSAEALSSLLEMEGFAVVTAHDGLDALNRLKNDNGIGVILLDLWMPVMNGSEFLRQKAEVAEIANTPVI